MTLSERLCKELTVTVTVSRSTLPGLTQDVLHLSLTLFIHRGHQGLAALSTRSRPWEMSPCWGYIVIDQRHPQNVHFLVNRWVCSSAFSWGAVIFFLAPIYQVCAQAHSQPVFKCPRASNTEMGKESERGGSLSPGSSLIPEIRLESAPRIKLGQPANAFRNAVNSSPLL